METGTVFQPNKPNVVHEVIDGEAVIVNLKNGTYYSTDKVGADVWTLIENGLPVSQIIEDIEARYVGDKDTITQSIMQLISQLQKENLIVFRVGAENSTEEINDHVEPPKVEPEGSKIPFEKPRLGKGFDINKIPFEEPKLEKYSDMEDLLLLDPIHDVEDEGWPKANVPEN